QDLTALAVEFGQVPTHTLHIRVELDAARGPAQGLGEQKLIPAVGTVELDLRRRQAAFGLAQLGLDLGQLLPILPAALGLRHQPLLQLQADSVSPALAVEWLARGRVAGGRGRARRRRIAGGGLSRRSTVERFTWNGARLGRAAEWPPVPTLCHGIGKAQS